MFASYKRIMTRKIEIQVEKKHYYGRYDNLPRFISYFYQIELAKGLNPKTILEIGVGNKTVSNYLKQHRFDLTTCDFDEELEPDCVADIRELPFRNNCYDLVIACEILEHLPWGEVDKALGELYRVTKRYTIVSIACARAAFELVFRFPRIAKILKRPFISIFLRMPLSFMKIRFRGQHYWEIGRWDYPIRKIRQLLRKRFDIQKEVTPMLSSYHRFFILEKR
jgi:SAM-dependent methyltransferase